MDLVSLALINSGEFDCPIIDWQEAVSANLVQLTVLAVFYSPLFNLLCLSINCSKKWFAGRSCQHQSVWWNSCYLCQSWKLKSTITAVVMRHIRVTETATVDISSFFLFFTLLHVGVLLVNLSPWYSRIVKLMTCYSWCNNLKNVKLIMPVLNFQCTCDSASTVNIITVQLSVKLTLRVPSLH